MKTDEFKLWYYLKRSPIFRWADDWSWGFHEKYTQPSTEMPYSNCGYRDFLKAAHDAVCKGFEAREEGFEPLFDLPREIVYSPSALTFVMRNPEIMNLAKQGEYTLEKILQLAVKNGHR